MRLLSKTADMEMARHCVCGVHVRLVGERKRESMDGMVCRAMQMQMQAQMQMHAGSATCSHCFRDKQVLAPFSVCL